MPPGQMKGRGVGEVEKVEEQTGSFLFSFWLILFSFLFACLLALFYFGLSCFLNFLLGWAAGVREIYRRTGM